MASEKKMTDTQKWLILAGLVLSGWLLYLLAPVLSPFLVAAFLAYLGDPITDKLEHLKLSRTLSVIIVFAVMLLGGVLLLLILIPLLQEQLLALLDRLPRIINWTQDVFLPWLFSAIGADTTTINLDVIRQALTENWQDVGNILGFVLGKVGHSGRFLLAWLAYLVLVPVVTFYLLRDWDILVANVRALLPKRYESTLVKLAGECDGVLAEFLRGQLSVMLALGIIYFLGLWLAGLEFALLIGLSAGLVSFVPYLGAIVGIGMATALAFIQFHDFIHLFYVALVFGFGQAIEGMVLSPWLVGDRIGLHPVAVIFAVMAGGQLFGFLGILLALPVAAMITVLLRFIHQQYLDSNVCAS
ncbi:MAG: AI-2E family transporter [Gammaproteobacteria bacterium]